MARPAATRGPGALARACTPSLRLPAPALSPLHVCNRRPPAPPSAPPRSTPRVRPRVARRRYGFNPGSTLYVHGYARDMARSAVTTTLSAAAGGLSGLYLKKWLPEKLGGTGTYDVGHTCNSLLGG